jgi:hypothetical protein
MGFLDGLMGSLVDPVKITHDTIQGTLEDVAEELGCTHQDFFVMIKPCNETFTMRFYIYRTDSGKPTLVREITLEEILKND